MDDRTANILEQLVAEYIEQARPIGSSYLVEHLKLALSPATIRSILHDLEQTGYINQPHTSAGRIPTDKGYRHYVNNLQPEQLKKTQHSRLREQLMADGRTTAEAASRVLSRFSRALAMTGDPERGQIHDAGFVEVVEESDTLDMVREISRLREALEEGLDQLMDMSDQQTTVFIGHENPVMNAEHTSLLIRRVKLAQQEEVVLMIVGPKRMAYERNISLVDSMAQLLKELPL